jgi:hypothetical protein
MDTKIEKPKCRRGRFIRRCFVRLERLDTVPYLAVKNAIVRIPWEEQRIVHEFGNCGTEVLHVLLYISFNSRHML